MSKLGQHVTCLPRLTSRSSPIYFQHSQYRQVQIVSVEWPCEPSTPFEYRFLVSPSISFAQKILHVQLFLAYAVLVKMAVPHLCSYCSKAARTTCSGCGDVYDSTTEEQDLTWYCGAACQKADWGKHRAACEAAQSRRVLYRTCEIAQHLLYILQKNCYMSLIVKAERQEDSWVIWKGQHPGKSIVVPFPEELFPDVEARKAILFFHCCNAAVAYLHDLFKEMLKGIFLLSVLCSRRA